MFLLIIHTNANATTEKNFNTSHVSINPSWEVLKMWKHFISIHPMFLLIDALGNVTPEFY